MFVWVLALLAVIAQGAAPSPAVAPAPPPSDLPPELHLAIDRQTRLLVIAPHPDDEALGAAGLIRRVQASGGAVRVLVMTSGDGFPEGVERAEGIAQPKPSDFRNYGSLRERETRSAMALLGLRADQVTFLGYPDEGLCHLASTYLFDKTRAFQSPYSDRASPPATERLVRGVRYRGVDVRLELERVVTEFAPTLIVLPHPEDDHPDHCSTHIFAREALGAVPGVVSRRVRVLHYLIHYEQWPLSADAGVGSSLRPPADFPPGEGRWVSLPLTLDESAAKKRALLEYASQMEVIGRFMTAFGRDNELFIDGEPRSLPECWCDDGDNVATEKPPSQYRRRPPRL